MDIHITAVRSKYIGFTGRLLRISMAVGMLIATLLMLSACGAKEPIHALVEQAIPFAKSETKWREHSLIDEDAYGRKLYAYLSQGNEINNAFSDFVTVSKNSPILFYIISQKEDDGAVYCYESDCYMYVSSFDGVSAAELEAFRQRNDWNKPIIEEKITAYATDGYQEHINSINGPSADEMAMKALNVFLARTVNDYYIDAIVSAQGKPVFVVREVLVWVTENVEGDENIFGKSYVFTLNDAFEVDACHELIGSIDTWPDQINEFKHSVGAYSSAD